MVLTNRRKPKQSELVSLDEMLTVPVQVLKDVLEQIQDYSGSSAKQRKKRLESIGELDRLYEFYVKYATEFTRLTGMVEYIQQAESRESKLREGSKVSPITEIVSNERQFLQSLEKILEKNNFTIPESIFPKNIFEE